MEQVSQLEQSIIYREGQEDIKQYAEFVRTGLARTRKGYEEMFNEWIGRWNGEVEVTIRGIVENSSSNQILPKLELVYTTFINQEAKVLINIQNIGAILLGDSYGFPAATVPPKEKQVELLKDSTDPFKATTTFYNNTAPNKFGRSTSNKNRSLSFGNGRRRLSKTNCFAEAKKVEVPISNYLQSGSQNMFKTANNDRIKKGKKKEENGFKYLDKCLNSTSASNFMLNYLVRTENQQDYRPRIKSPMKQKSKRQSKQNKQVPEEEVRISINGKPQKKSSELQVSQSKGHERRNSGTYQKMMENFQDKISQKLDLLMNKYTQIEQRLQRSESEKKIQIVKLDKTDLIKESNQRTIGNISQNVSVIKEAIQDVKVVDREPFKVKQVCEVTKQTKNTFDLTKKSNGNQASIKSIVPKNKIMRNKVQQNLIDADVEVYNLQKDKPVPKEKETKKEGQNISTTDDSKQKSKFERDQQYIEKLILEFNQNTSKFILPISKQLLFVLKNKYISFSTIHFLPVNQTIQSIETEKVQNENKSMKEHLEKMRKLLKLNCGPQKKEKILIYFNSFLRTYLSFDSENSIISKDRSKDNNTEELISEAFAQLG